MWVSRQSLELDLRSRFWTLSAGGGCVSVSPNCIGHSDLPPLRLVLVSASIHSTVVNCILLSRFWLSSLYGVSWPRCWRHTVCWLMLRGGYLFKWTWNNTLNYEEWLKNSFEKRCMILRIRGGEQHKYPLAATAVLLAHQLFRWCPTSCYWFVLQAFGEKTNSCRFNKCI